MLLPKQYIEDDKFHHNSSSISLPSGQSNFSDACYLRSETPSTYIGEFKNDMLNGPGVWTTDTGERYAGHFKDNIMITHLRPTIVIQPAAPAVPPPIPAPAQAAQSVPPPCKASGHRYPDILNLMRTQSDGGPPTTRCQTGTRPASLSRWSGSGQRLNAPLCRLR